MAKVTIDGKEVTVAEGRLVLEVAKDLGIDVPTFCYQERLTPLASCRMCLVEIEGRRRLEPACATAVADGMVIRTDTPIVAEIRKSMLEMLLANHPLDCPICDKAGECELQDMVFKYGAGESHFRDQKRVFRENDLLLNSVIIFNAERCIQCQRCVRMCEEVVGAVALGTIEKGMDSEVTGFANSLSGCDHCGNCIEVCPVGALMSEPYRYKSRPWDLVETDTVCTYCGTGCALTVGVRDGHLARVRSKYETGVNAETLCAKGRFGIDLIDSERRIKRPQIRRNGVLAAVSWEEALNYIAERMKGIQKAGGQIGGLASPRMTNEALYLFQKMMRTALHTNNIDSATRWATAPIDTTLGGILSDLYTRDPLHRVLDAECIFVIGSAVTDDNPITDYLLRGAVKNHGAQLLIASARPSRLDRDAAAALRILPGSEAALLAGILKGLDAGTASGAGDFQARAAAVLDAAKSVTILVGIDLLRAPAASEGLAWLHRLAEVLRDKGKKPAVQFLFDRPNQLGAMDMGVLPGRLPGGIRVDDDTGRGSFEEAWGVPPAKEAGLDLRQMLQQAAAGRLDALWVFGGDPVLSSPDRDFVEQALANIELLVVQDAFHSDICGLAHVVLPGASFVEEQGTFTNNEGRVQKLRQIWQPSFEAKQNVEIFDQFASLLECGLGPETPEQIFAEIARLVRPYQGLDFGALGENGVFTASLARDGLASGPTEQFDPRPIDGPFGNGDLALVTGDCRFHSGSLSAHSATLAGLESEPYMEMSIADAATRGLEDGTMVSVASDHGAVTVALRVHKRYADGIVFIPENFPSLKLNRLFADAQYPCRVNVEAQAMAETLVLGGRAI
ncbi:NADH-quinone oxidoreductase subunit NuoG [bacterium AH-315-P15]|nr:NADH-quinone oxidoreductase subunit NuoG [bacterium AH-315-P15]